MGNSHEECEEMGKIESALKDSYFILTSVTSPYRIGKRRKTLHRVLHPRTGYLVTMQYAMGTRPSDISSHLLLDMSPPTVLYGAMTKDQK